MVVPVTPGNPTTDSGYVQFNVTVTASGVPQQLSVTHLATTEYILQVPFGGAAINIGGSTVSASTGVSLLPPADAATTPDGFSDYIDDLSKVYIVGTIGTVVRVVYRTL